MVEDFSITGCRSVDKPWDSFQSDSNVDNFDWQLLVISFIVVLVLHKHHVTKFESMDKVLNWRAHVSSPGPDILNKSNLLRINLQFFSKPSVVEFNTLFFEENVILGFVENVNTQHDEPWIMSACQTNVIQIIESDTKNGFNGWIFWRIKFSCDTVGLEAINTSCYVFNIISPSGNDWVSGDGFARNSGRVQRSFKSIPSIFVGDILSLKTDTTSLTNESVLSFAAMIRWKVTLNLRKWLRQDFFSRRNGHTFRIEIYWIPSWRRSMWDNTFQDFFQTRVWWEPWFPRVRKKSTLGERHLMMDSFCGTSSAYISMVNK